MSEKASLEIMTREKLYELIWSTTATKLGKQFGVSAVAILRRCKRQNIPRPGRGYWAKVAVGKASQIPPLPPIPAEALAAAAKNENVEVPTLPTNPETMNPLAAALVAKIKTASLDSDRLRVHLRERELPEVKISKVQAQRAAAAFHALLKIVEPQGIMFRRSLSSYDGGFFRRGNERLYFKIEEGLIDKPGNGGRARQSYSQWDTTNKVASGLVYRQYTHVDDATKRTAIANLPML